MLLSEMTLYPLVTGPVWLKFFLLVIQLGFIMPPNDPVTSENNPTNLQKPTGL